MQGRYGKSQGNDPWDRTSSDSHAALNGSGKQRAMPRRPPGMTRLDTPPTTHRIARPQRQEKPPKKRGRRFLIFVAALAICALLVFVVVYGLANYFLSLGSSAGAANTTTDFLLNLKSQNYAQAYKDLDAVITISQHPQDFQSMGQADDRCYGPVKDFNEVAGSATTSSDGNTQSYAYTMTRSKLSKPYQLTLTLQKDSDGNWDITSYGADLGPAPPTCK